MAKRKIEVKTQPWSPGGRYYDVWIDEDLLDDLGHIGGIQEVKIRGSYGPSPYYIALDPRYDAAEVIAEVEALGTPKKEPGLYERAGVLGKDAAKKEQALGTMKRYLDVACAKNEELLRAACSLLSYRLQYKYW